MDGRLRRERGIMLDLRPRGSENYNIDSTRLKLLTKTSHVRNALFKGKRHAKGISVVALTVGVFSCKVSPGLSFTSVPHVHRACRHLAEVRIRRHSPCTKSLIFSTFSNSRRSTVTGKVT